MLLVPDASMKSENLKSTKEFCVAMWLSIRCNGSNSRTMNQIIHPKAHKIASDKAPESFEVANGQSRSKSHRTLVVRSQKSRNGALQI